MKLYPPYAAGVYETHCLCKLLPALARQTYHDMRDDWYAMLFKYITGFCKLLARVAAVYEPCGIVVGGLEPKLCPYVAA